MHRQSFLITVFLSSVFLLSFLVFPSSAHAFTLTTTGNTTGLVGWWTFDGKDMQSNVKDVSGNGNNGYLVGQAATTTVQGRVGQALNFDGVDDVVNAGNIAGADNIEQMSIGGWVKFNSTNTSQSIIAKDWYGVQDQWQLYLNGNFNRASFIVFNTVATVAFVESGNSTFVANRWYHVMGVYDGAFVHLYVNGVEVGTPAALTGNVRDQNAMVCLGGTAGGSATCNYSGFQLKGALDDIRLYSRALSASEVRGLYSQGSNKFASSPVVGSTTNCTAGLSCGLVGYWTFDGKDMQSNVKDVSGNGNNGYLVGQAATTTVQGRVGQALNFDGVDDAVTLGDVAGSDNVSAVTVSVWYKAKNNYFTGGTNGGMVTKEGLGGLSWSLYKNNAGATIGFWVNGTNGLVGTLNLINIEDTNWHQYVGVYDGSNVMLYKDGQLHSIPQPQSGVVTNSTTAVCIGAANYFSAGRCDASFSNNILDDVRIYNRALSATEIKQLYNQSSNKISASAPVTPTPACTSGLSCGLVGYWTFDGKNTPWTSSTAGTAIDSSGNGNTGTLNGMNTATAPIMGKVGQGLKFDGVDDYVNTNYAWSSSDPDMTISTWFKTTAAAVGGLPILSSYGGQLGYIALLVNSGGSLNPQILDTSNNSVAITSPLGYNDNSWHHVAMVLSGTTLKLYVDGSLVGTNTNASLTGNFRDSNADTLKIAKSGNFSFLPGTIDDVRIYRRALSLVEITSLYNMGR